MIDKTPSADSMTVIGADAAFKGELTFSKGVRVDGKIEGRITTKGHLAVSQGGKLMAEVQAGNILVEGEVTGNLRAAERIQLKKTARLKGDVFASKLLVEEGATFVGQCNVGPDAVANAPTSAAAGTNRLVQKEALPRK